jgi:hypothetical protein
MYKPSHYIPPTIWIDEIKKARYEMRAIVITIKDYNTHIKMGVWFREEIGCSWILQNEEYSTFKANIGDPKFEEKFVPELRRLIKKHILKQ